MLGPGELPGQFCPDLDLLTLTAFLPLFPPGWCVRRICVRYERLRPDSRGLNPVFECVPVLSGGTSCLCAVCACCGWTVLSVPVPWVPRVAHELSECMCAASCTAPVGSGQLMWGEHPDTFWILFDLKLILTGPQTP